jgi:predicted NAD-dependent protein-ADP-ribosyltransferase YbiA (DUF1768 family)
MMAAKALGRGVRGFDEQRFGFALMEVRHQLSGQR